MKITKSQLKDIIREELEGVVGPSPTTSARLLKERKDRIRIQLDETYSPAHLDELAEILAEAEEAYGPVPAVGGATPAAAGGGALTGQSHVAGRTGSPFEKMGGGGGAVDPSDILPKFAGGRGWAGAFETLGETLIWANDALPNVIQIFAEMPEEEVQQGGDTAGRKAIVWAIKGMRTVMRIGTLGIIKGLGHMFIKLSESIEDLPPEKMAMVNVAMSGGSITDVVAAGGNKKARTGGAPQLGAGSPAGRAGIAERKRSLKRRR